MTALEKRKRNNSGMVLVTVMLIMLGILAVSLIGVCVNGANSTSNGLMTQTSNDAQMSNARTKHTSAFNLAESGVEYTLQWLNTQSSPPNPNANWTAFAPAIWGATDVGSPARSVVNLKDANGGNVGSFSVEMYPDATDPGNSQKRYIIESQGNCDGNTLVLRVYVQQKSFGGYAYFNDVEVSNGYWVTGMNQFDGPMHSNNSTAGSNAFTPTNILWNSSPGVMFKYQGTDAFTSSAPSINWYKGNLSTQTAPATNADWLSVAAGGSATVHTNAPKVPMPTSTTTQKTAALGTAAVPSTNGVVVSSSSGNTNGGIYIHGNVDNMAMSINGAGDQVMQITQHDSTHTAIVSTVTVALHSVPQTTTLTTVSYPTSGGSVTKASTVNGITNGVLYADGNIGSPGSTTTPGYGLSGQIADNVVNASNQITTPNSWTIATDPTKTLYLNGALTYKTSRAKTGLGNYVVESQDQNFVLHAGTLGLLSKTVVVTDRTASNVDNKNMEIDAATLAFNTFNAADYGTRTAGTFTVMGGYIAGTAGIFGEIDNNGNLLSGLAEHYHYDARLADNPPPYFPTTGTQYDVVSWQHVTSLLQ